MSTPFIFDQVIEPALKEYLPRTTLESEISEQLEKLETGCLLIVGGPGAGKTSLAAHFIDKLQCLHHFLRPGHTEFSLWSDPHAFLTSVAFQLRERFGEDIFPEAVALDVEGKVHMVGKSGSFTGIKIDRLIAVPWRRERYKVDFRSKHVEGRVVGIHISELIEDYRGIPLQAFREMALLDPLRRIREIAADVKVVLWVDGLDEEAFAQAYTSDSGRSIAQVLPLGSEFAAIGNARLVISSRRGSHLERFQRDGGTVIDIDADQYHQDRRSCVEQIFDQEIDQAESDGFFSLAQWPVEEFKATVIERAEDNPLYIRQLFRALEDPLQRESILRDREVPTGLSSIQKSLLSRLLPTRATPEHEHTYRILAVLSVALSELSLRQLAAIVAIEPNQAHVSISRLAPMLRKVNNAGVSLYHSSLRDLISDRDNRGQAWGVDPQSAHAMIGDYYFPADTSAQLPEDDYGYEYGTTHLANADFEKRIRLFHMMDSTWRQQLRSRSRTNYRFLADLERSWTAIRTTSQANQKQLPIAACQLGLMHSFVEDAMSEVSNETLELMVRLGMTQQALQSLPTGESGVIAARRCRAILAGLAANNFESRALATEVLRKGLQHLQAPEVGNWYFWEVAELLRVGEPGVFPTRVLLDELRDVFIDHPVDSHTVQAFAELARLWAAYEKDTATFFLKQATNHVANAADDAKARLADIWLNVDAAAASDQLAELNIDKQISTQKADQEALPAEELAEGWKKLYQHRGSGLPPVSVRALVYGQIKNEPNILEAYGANLNNRDLRGQVYCAAARYYLTSDTEKAREYLQRARDIQEHPHSSGPVRHFYYSVAHQISPDEYDWAEQTFQNVGVNLEACALWRLKMIERFLPEHLERALELFDRELQVWGGARVNASTICEFPSWVARNGVWYGLVERIEPFVQDLEGPIQRRLMSIVMCGYYLTSDPQRVAAHLERVYTPTEDGNSDLQEWEILSFAAGQLWRTEHGPVLLEKAKAQIDKIVGNNNGEDDFGKLRRNELRSSCLATMAMKLHYGSLEAAKQVLIELVEIEPSKRGEEMTFPYAAIPEYRLAGMPWTEYVFGTIAAAIALKDPDDMPLPPRNGYWSAALGLAYSTAAREGYFHDLPQQLSWCSKAHESAKKVLEPQVRRLLLGDIACAYSKIKANQSALDIARPLAEEILASREFHIAKRMFGHAHALGRCIEVFCQAELLYEALDLLWKARIIGAGAFYVLMSTLPERLSSVIRFSTNVWQTIELRGFEVYPRDEPVAK